MFKYFATTTAILLWCLVLSLVWTQLSFVVLASRKNHSAIHFLRQLPILPSLVIAPVLLVVSYRFLNINLIYPVQALASTFDIALASFIPAAVLFICCGLAIAIPESLAREFQYWRHRTFTNVAAAYGRTPESSIYRVVYLKTVLDCWSQCLPWLFSEMIVIEAVFNAPGIGLDAWHQARMREWTEMLAAISSLAALYVACVALTALGTRWLGKRLEGYA